MSNDQPTQSPPEGGEKSREELSDEALAEVSAGVIAIRPPGSSLQADPDAGGEVASLFNASGLQEGALYFKYDIKGNKEG